MSGAPIYALASGGTRGASGFDPVAGVPRTPLRVAPEARSFCTTASRLRETTNLHARAPAANEHPGAGVWAPTSRSPMSVVAATSHEDARLRYARVHRRRPLPRLGLLGARLVQMQIVDSAEYLTEAEGNAIETEDRPPGAAATCSTATASCSWTTRRRSAVTVSARYFDRESKLPLVAELAMRAAGAAGEEVR